MLSLNGVSLCSSVSLCKLSQTAGNLRIRSVHKQYNCDSKLHSTSQYVRSVVYEATMLIILTIFVKLTLVIYIIVICYRLCLQNIYNYIRVPSHDESC